MTAAQSAGVGIGTAYYEYDPASNVTHKVLGNGSFTYFAYDPAGHVTQVLNCLPDGSPLVYFEYTYDAGGRITTCVRENGDVIYYGYDEADRLTSEQWYDSGMGSLYAFQWGYDLVGNRTYEKRDAQETYYTYDAANQLLHTVSGGAYSYFQYDLRGNCTAIQEPDGSRYFEYSPADLVTSIVYKNGTANYFYYDARQRRHAIEESDGLRYFTWDRNGMNLLSERDAGGSVTAGYSHGYNPIDGIGTMVAAQKTEGGATYYQYPIYDHRGTVMRLADESGSVTAYYEYDAWGNALREQESGATNRFRYQSNWLAVGDSAASLYVTPSRLYLGNVGRFLCHDPLRFATALNPHLYGRGNPTVGVDPSGLEFVGDRAPRPVMRLTTTQDPRALGDTVPTEQDWPEVECRRDLCPGTQAGCERLVIYKWPSVRMSSQILSKKKRRFRWEQHVLNWYWLSEGMPIEEVLARMDELVDERYQRLYGHEALRIGFWRMRHDLTVVISLGASAFGNICTKCCDEFEQMWLRAFELFWLANRAGQVWVYLRDLHPSAEGYARTKAGLQLRISALMNKLGQAKGAGVAFVRCVDENHIFDLDPLPIPPIFIPCF